MTLRTALVMNAGSIQQLQAADALGNVLARAVAGTGTISSGTVSFANSNGVSFGINGQTITAQLPSVRYWENACAGVMQPNGAATNSAGVNLSYQRFSIPYQISATRMDLLGHLTVAGSTAGSYTLSAVVYTMAGSTLGSASSGSLGVSFNSGTNATAASIYGAHSGTRWRSIPLGTWNLTAGEYMLGLMISQSGVAGTTGSWTVFGASSQSVNPAVAGGDVNAYFADGIYSAASGVFPATAHLTAINQTGASALRQPYVRMVGTF